MKLADRVCLFPLFDVRIDVERQSNIAVTGQRLSKLGLNTNFAEIRDEGMQVGVKVCVNYFVRLISQKTGFIHRLSSIGARPAETVKALGPAWMMDDEGGCTGAVSDVYQHLPQPAF